MFDYDESIEVPDDDDDDDEEFEQLVGGRKIPGVSPIRRPPFQRPTRSFIRGRQAHQHPESLDMSTDEGSPAPTGRQGEGENKSGRKMSTKDFTTQQSTESTGSNGKPENLMSMASSYAKKLMSGSDKKKVITYLFMG